MFNEERTDGGQPRNGGHGQEDVCVGLGDGDLEGHGEMEVLVEDDGGAM